MQKKDVIYIDVDEDITAIIDKVKASSYKILALVPPKRTGVLQSAVNLRLINRAATQQDKRLVIITNDSALAGLAAAASIPIAKNLQSKPELAEVPALSVDDGDDVIDGADLPIGEHARMPDGADPAEASDIASAGLVGASETRKASPPAGGERPRPKAKRGTAVPSFNRFRKRLVLIVLGVLLLVGFLVWAIFFAPRASINVTTRTTDVAVSQQVTLDPDGETSATSAVLRAIAKTQSEDVAVDFAATGKKNVGEAATGSVLINTSAETILISGLTVPAGTTITDSSGHHYRTDAAVSFAQGDASGLSGRSVGVTAVEPGAEYNGASGAASTDADGVTKVTFEGSTSGGTDKVVATVTQGDIDKAKQEALDTIDRQQASEKLKEQLDGEYVVLEDSLQVDTGDLKPNKTVDQEAPDGRAEYGGEVTYTMYAVAVADLDDYLKAVIEQQIDDQQTQQVYDTGAEQVQFTNVDRADDGLRATLSTNGKIGPRIDETQVKEQAAGKRIGDIKSDIEAINGVDSVDVTLSPFWVSAAPKNIDKITVEFTLDD